MLRLCVPDSQQKVLGSWQTQRDQGYGTIHCLCMSWFHASRREEVLKLATQGEGHEPELCREQHQLHQLARLTVRAGSSDSAALERPLDNIGLWINQQLPSVCLCVCLYARGHASEGAPADQKSESDPVELELQKTVNQLMWVQSSARTASFPSPHCVQSN